MSLSVISSFLLTVLGIVYAVATFMLPEAALGRPHEPKIFPAMLAIFCYVSYFFNCVRYYFACERI